LQDFLPGQRWISDAELPMGLGTVLASDQRTVTIVFLATGETRVYARQTAPLTRVVFAPGDNVRCHQGWTLHITAAHERHGLITYAGTRADGTPAELAEGELDNLIQLNRPADRLFTGQIDTDKWFELRYQTLQHAHGLAHSDLRGLTGGRTSLIAHQLYIAHEVATRYAPRVLLADEVGLGKTIEAGMILHHQLLTERARRVLIVVPESLLHQWLVEMLRRFNLRFSVFDEERCQAAETSADANNPFLSAQLVLCTLEFLLQYEQRFQQALACEWDFLVVDEAHHLLWSVTQPSMAYQCIEALAANTKGVLLLTATPEQLGRDSHFARLRLLDPHRFHDLTAFIAEEKSYAPIAATVEALQNDKPLTPDMQEVLRASLAEGDNQRLLDCMLNQEAGDAERSAARVQLIEHLLDRHGTGRVLFRNTRASIKGFPRRILHTYALPMPAQYVDSQRARAARLPPDGAADRLLLCPELLYQENSGNPLPHWTQIDPRMDWLMLRLKQLRPEKVLVIAASAGTAMDIASALRQRAGIQAAVFHEGLSLIERDRSAAFFADREFGSQVLVCSEIGSEGRNFQFAHHLVLFDLPLNPDLLEQRIGRLDRIGQTEAIKIHVPYLENSAQAALLHWYHQGLDAFEHTCPTGYSVFVQVEEELRTALRGAQANATDLAALIQATASLHRQLTDELQRGRDRLLEYNSCRPHIAEALRERAAQQDASTTVLDYLDAAFDCLGIDTQPHSDLSYIIRPADHMASSGLAELPAEGMTITADRATALACEDMQFITWEHPLVTDIMDTVLSNELGNCAITAVKNTGGKPGTLLLECIYLLESSASTALQSSRYLPPATLRVLIDAEGIDHAGRLTHPVMARAQEAVRPLVAKKIVRHYAPQLRAMLAAAEQLARGRSSALLAEAHAHAAQLLEGEIDRLKALKRINPNVRDEEIRFLQGQWEAVRQALTSAGVRLDALRVVALL
jgi:ATP-dependent helicase HepA